MATKNLWGDLSTLEVVRTPKAILEEQAAVLREATQGMLTAQVVDGRDEPRKEDFLYEFEIIAPALNYRYTLLWISHGVDLFPVSVGSDRRGRLAEALGVKGTADIVVCQDEAEFVVEVERILSSPRTKRVLARLLSQLQN
jgi:hypothetical protein